MGHIGRLTALAAMLCLAGVAPGYAQSAQANPNAQKPKKQPNQVPETGQDETAPADTSPFERVPENLLITRRADGTVMVQLDDSYMEATTATIGADGALTFSHYTGVGVASEAVMRTPVVAVPADGLLRARTLPLIFPILEEKE